MLISYIKQNINVSISINGYGCYWVVQTDIIMVKSNTLIIWCHSSRVWIAPHLTRRGPGGRRRGVPLPEAGTAEEDSGLRLGTGEAATHRVQIDAPGPAISWLLELATNLCEDFTLTEKASTRAFTWSKVPTCALTFKILFGYFGLDIFCLVKCQTQIAVDRIFHF